VGCSTNDSKTLLEFLMKVSARDLVEAMERSVTEEVSETYVENITIYEGCLKSSWTQLIIPSRNFVEVRWRSLF
jgi:hypothetical protein